MRKIDKIITISLIILFIFMGCNNISDNDSNIREVVISKPITSDTPSVIASHPSSELFVEPVVDEKPFSDEEVEAIVKTLVGECYDDKIEDKRKVSEVIVNRVSNGGFGENVMEVVTAPGQFCGYWKQSRPISESDIQIAEETLTDWYANNCEALSEYLFFCSGANRENVFRSEY